MTKEAYIIEHLRKMMENNPDEFKANINGLSLLDRARILAFIQTRNPDLYKKVRETIND